MEREKTTGFTSVGLLVPTKTMLQLGLFPNMGCTKKKKVTWFNWLLKNHTVLRSLLVHVYFGTFEILTLRLVVSRVLGIYTLLYSPSRPARLAPS